MIIAEGQFEGRGTHEMRGTFRFEQTDGGPIIFTTSDDFFFDGSPRPGFALSVSGNNTEDEAIATDFLRLPNSGSTSPQNQLEVTGVQTGTAPSGIVLTDQKTLFLWCFLFPSLLGVGVINHVS